MTHAPPGIDFRQGRRQPATGQNHAARLARAMRQFGTLTVLASVASLYAQTVETEGTWERLRDARIRQLVGPEDAPLTPGKTTEARRYYETMNRSPGGRGLWDEPRFNNVPLSAASVSASLGRLRQIALAWRSPGNSMWRDPDVAKDVVSAALWLTRGHYHVGIPYDGDQSRWGNWFPWQIGIPRELVDLVILLYHEFTPAERVELLSAIDHFCPTPHLRVDGSRPETGANLMSKMSIFVLRGIAGQRSDKIEEAKRFLPELLQLRDALGGDGYYSDGSFIQHDDFIYTNAYGQDLLTRIVPMLELVSASPWKFEAHHVRTVAELALDAHASAIIGGKLLPSFQGRAVAFDGDPWAAAIAAELLRLSSIVEDAPLVAELRATAARIIHDIERAQPGRFFRACDPDLARLAGGLEPAGPTPPQVRVFRFGDRAVAHHPVYGLDIAMYSRRRADYESLNGQNYQGWHSANGMTYLFTRDFEQWAGDYWVTSDMLRLPGTTIYSQTPGAQALVRFTAENAGNADRATVSRSRSETLRFVVRTIEDGAAVLAEFPPLDRSPTVNDKFSTMSATLRIFGTLERAAAASEAHPASATLACLVPSPRTASDREPREKGLRQTVSSRAAWYEFDVLASMRWVQTSAGVVFDYPVKLQLADDANDDVSFSFALTGDSAPQLTLRINRNPLASDASWVGGTVFEGRYAAVGMQLCPPGSGLRAKKSWFLFDREIVALGADIHGNSRDTAVETSLWDYLLRVDNANTLLVNGAPRGETDTGPVELQEIQTLFLSGNQPGSSLGVYLPQPTSLISHRAPRTGRSDALRYSATPSRPVTRWRHALWINHGVAPTGSGYAYVLLPDSSAASVAAYAQAPAVEIIENSPRAQIVYHRGLGLLAANIWSAAGASFVHPATGMEIHVSGLGSLILRESKARIEMALADPTHEDHAPLEIQLNRTVIAADPSGAAHHVRSAGGKSIVTFPLARTKGKTLSASFIKRPAP